MFLQLLVTAISYGMLRNVVNSRWVGIRSAKNFVVKQMVQSAKLIRYAPVNCLDRNYRVKIYCLDCETDRNIISDNCNNCCCKQILLTPQTNKNKNCNDDTVTVTECGNSKSNVRHPDFSEQDDETLTDVSSNSKEISSENESNCPPIPSCPSSTSTCFNPSSDTQVFKKNHILSMIPAGIPIIPSPQLDFLINSGKMGFSNIKDLNLSTIKPPSIQKTLAQEPPVDNFPPHDCCIGCNGVKYKTSNDNEIKVLAANTFNKNRRNYELKCKSKRLKKLMIANIRRDASLSKQLIQQAAETKFSTKFNVICSRGHLSYVIHTNEYCEVSSRGINCYAFRTYSPYSI